MRALLLLASLLVAGCVTPPVTVTPTPPTPPGETPSPLLASPAFDDGGTIPKSNTCDGDDRSPPLAVVANVSGATHLALIAYDPDAPLPQAATRNITHWIFWNAPLSPAGALAFAEGRVTPGTIEGANENGAEGYMGPCPPQLSPPHRYVFHAFALAAPLDLPPGSTRAQLEAALAGHSLADTTLIGMYARSLPP